VKLGGKERSPLFQEGLSTTVKIYFRYMRVSAAHVDVQGRHPAANFCRVACARHEAFCRHGLHGAVPEVVAAPTPTDRILARVLVRECSGGRFNRG